MKQNTAAALEAGAALIHSFNLRHAFSSTLQAHLYVPATHARTHAHAHAHAHTHTPAHGPARIHTESDSHVFSLTEMYG